MAKFTRSPDVAGAVLNGRGTLSNISSGASDQSPVGMARSWVHQTAAIVGQASDEVGVAKVDRATGLIADAATVAAAAAKKKGPVDEQQVESDLQAALLSGGAAGATAGNGGVVVDGDMRDMYEAFKKLAENTGAVDPETFKRMEEILGPAHDLVKLVRKRLRRGRARDRKKVNGAEYHEWYYCCRGAGQADTTEAIKRAAARGVWPFTAVAARVIDRETFKSPAFKPVRRIIEEVRAGKTAPSGSGYSA